LPFLFPFSSWVLLARKPPPVFFFWLPRRPVYRLLSSNLSANEFPPSVGVGYGPLRKFRAPTPVNVLCVLLARCAIVHLSPPLPPRLVFCTNVKTYAQPPPPPVAGMFALKFAQTQPLFSVCSLLWYEPFFAIRDYPLALGSLNSYTGVSPVCVSGAGRSGFFFLPVPSCPLLFSQINSLSPPFSSKPPGLTSYNCRFLFLSLTTDRHPWVSWVKPLSRWDLLFTLHVAFSGYLPLAPCLPPLVFLSYPPRVCPLVQPTPQYRLSVNALFPPRQTLTSSTPKCPRQFPVMKRSLASTPQGTCSFSHWMLDSPFVLRQLFIVARHPP